MLSIILALAALAATNLASPFHEKRWDNLKVKHEWVQTPKHWTEVGPAPSESKVRICGPPQCQYEGASESSGSFFCVDY